MLQKTATYYIFFILTVSTSLIGRLIYSSDGKLYQRKVWFLNSGPETRLRHSLLFLALSMYAIHVLVVVCEKWIKKLAGGQYLSTPENAIHM